MPTFVKGLNNTQYQYFENSLTIPIPIPKFQHPNTTLIQWEKGRRVVFSTKEDVLPAAGTKRPLWSAYEMTNTKTQDQVNFTCFYFNDS